MNPLTFAVLTEIAVVIATCVLGALRVLPSEAVVAVLTAVVTGRLKPPMDYGGGSSSGGLSRPWLEPSQPRDAYGPSPHAREPPRDEGPSILPCISSVGVLALLMLHRMKGT